MFRSLLFAASIFFSNWSMAEMISAETSCPGERHQLRTLAQKIPQTVSCRTQIDRAAKCCAGDESRPECMSSAVSIDAGGGGRDAARIDNATWQAVKSQVLTNISRCDDQREKVSCRANEREALNYFNRALTAMTNCLQQGVAKLDAASAEAIASQNAASRYDDRVIASDQERGYNPEDIHQVGGVTQEQVRKGYVFKGDNGQVCTVTGVGPAGCRVQIGNGPTQTMDWDRVLYQINKSRAGGD